MAGAGRSAMAAVCAALWLAAPGSRAAAQQEVVAPPVRTDETPVLYPVDATGSASVLLELRVDREGRVTESHVIEGEEPFTGAALSAAASWRFEPARRAGVPVDARIRVQVDFKPPEKPSPPPEAAPYARPPPFAPGPSAPAPPAAKPPAEAVEQVNVHGVRPEPGRQEMTGAEVRQLPGAFGDAFRAIEALPGVTPLVSGLPYFLVRGAPPGDTGFFIDGVRVPALFHLGVGAAVVHPGLIDKVDFYPGGYPARFGRFSGGILSGEVLPTPDRPHADAGVRLLDSGALVSTPFSEGRGDFLASGRYGYPGPLLSLFVKDTGLAYWDYQTRTRWRASNTDELGAFVFGSYDSVSVRSSSTGQMVEVLGLQFHRADLRWDHKTSDTGSLRVALTLGYDRSAAGDASNAGNSTFIENETVAARADWSERLGPDADVRAGADALFEPYRVVAPVNGPLNSITGASFGGESAAFVQDDLDAGAYAELVWRPTRRVELHPGLRIDLFSAIYPSNATLGGVPAESRAVGAVDPRLSARWELTPSVAWIAALGIAHQASNIPFPSPGLQFSQLSRGLQAAFQYTTGAEVQLPAEFTATGNVFVHDYTGLADFYETCPPGESTCTFGGRSVGLELLVRRPLTKRFSGWVSYTLSRTERDSYFDGAWLRRLSEFDRTHVANVVLAADLGARWRAGARLLAYSGLPYSTTTANQGPPDTRGPPFVRLDLRIEKKWNALGGTMTLAFEWLNALLSKETISTTCAQNFFGSPAGPTIQCTPQEIGPITFPSLGLEAAW